MTRSGEGREVAVNAGEHAGPGPVEPVQVGQASPQPFRRVSDLRPRRRGRTAAAGTASARSTR
jgi:hypothetical protein